MTVRFKDSSGTSVIAHVRFRDASGLSDISAIRFRDASGLSSILSSLAASGPDSADGFGYSAKPITVTTNTITVAVTGQIGTAHHSWSFADTGWTATAPSSPTTAFRRTLAAGDTQSTTATDTITDDGGQSTTVDVILTCTNDY